MGRQEIFSLSLLHFGNDSESVVTHRLTGFVRTERSDESWRLKIWIELVRTRKTLDLINSFYFCFFFCVSIHFSYHLRCWALSFSWIFYYLSLTLHYFLILQVDFLSASKLCFFANSNTFDAFSSLTWPICMTYRIQISFKIFKSKRWASS